MTHETIIESMNTWEIVAEYESEKEEFVSAEIYLWESEKEKKLGHRSDYSYDLGSQYLTIINANEDLIEKAEREMLEADNTPEWDEMPANDDIGIIV